MSIFVGVEIIANELFESILDLSLVVIARVTASD